MLRRLAVASVVFTTACAGTQKPDTAGATAAQAAPVQERQKITNQPAFDVATCHPRQLTLPTLPNQAVIIGALVSARPQVLECLVDPKNRGPGQSTKVTVKTTVDTTGGKHAITGDNLSPSGTQCVQAMVDKLAPMAALPAGAQPVEAQTEFVHEVGNSPTVTFGINEGSDFSGNIRLGQTTWCDCYTSFTNTPPPLLTARIKLKKGMANAAEINFDPSGTTEGDALASCLKTKIAALPAKLSTDELTFPHRFIHFHSLASENVANLPPELGFYQLELVRGQRAADAALAFGVRANAAETYDAIVAEYTKTKNWRLIDSLKAKCADLVKAADGWVSALQAQQAADQSTLTLVQQLKAKDEGWTQVETATQGALGKTAEDLKTAQARRQADADACPKERKR